MNKDSAYMCAKSVNVTEKRPENMRQSTSDDSKRTVPGISRGNRLCDWKASSAIRFIVLWPVLLDYE